MELSERKYILNTKELPGFSNGYDFAGRSKSMSVGAGYTGGRLDTSSPGLGFFKSIGNAIGSAGKAIGSAASATGKFLGLDNKMFGTNGAAVASGAIGAIDMIGSIGAAGKYEKTADDLLQDAGTSQQNIGGVSYTVQNGIDKGQEESEVSASNTANTVGLMGKGASTGAAIGSLLGPIGGGVGAAIGAVGGFIGGLFGGDSKKREMKRQMKLAEIKRINQNDFNRSGALTTVIQNNLALAEGDQTQLTLYGAADGLLPGFVGGFIPNCRLSNGEHIILHDNFGNPVDDIKVGHGRDNKDTVIAYLPENAAVITNKNGATKHLEEKGDIQGAKYLTAMNLQKKGYKNGKLPGFNDGTAFAINNILGNFVPAAWLFARANEINNQALYKPTSEQLADNPGIHEGLRDMDQQISKYYVLPRVNDMLSKGFYQINNAGGISGGQRNLLRLGAIKDAMNSMQDQFRTIDQMNAQFKQQLGQAKVNAYSDIADRAMKGRWQDDATYAQEHGNKIFGVSDAIANAFALAGNGYKGFNDWNMFDRNMRYFEDEQALRNADREAKLTEQKNMNLAKSLWTGLGINPYVTLHALQNTASVPQPTVTGTKILLTKELKDAIKQQQKAAKLQQKQARIKARQEQREAELQKKVLAKTEKLAGKPPYFTPFLPEDAIFNAAGTGWVSGGRYVGIK